MWPNEEGKLDYDEQLEEVARDSRVVLSREIRHGILKLTADKRAVIAEKPDAESTAPVATAVIEDSTK